MQRSLLRSPKKRAPMLSKNLRSLSPKILSPSTLRSIPNLINRSLNKMRRNSQSKRPKRKRREKRSRKKKKRLSSLRKWRRKRK